MTGSLCETCAHKKEVVSAKGSRFLLCRLSQSDRRFPKYPPQPVAQCVGYTKLIDDKLNSPTDLRPIVQAILSEYSLPLDGIHGVSHWGRVLENGLRLCETTGAKVEVVRLFAVFHDSKRVNDSSDPDHGQRGADFADSLRGRLFHLPDGDFKLLYRACAGHTHELTHPDPTIQTCWDSDRLDLGRVGITPHPSRLCTAQAKTRDMILWADGRASFGVVPSFVLEEWGVEVEGR